MPRRGVSSISSHPVGLQPGDLGADVLGLERDVMDARPALRQELADRCICPERSKELDPRLADPQRCRLDALVVDALAVLQRRAEQRRPADDRRVEVVDRNPDVVDVPRHETTSSTVAMRTPPPCQSTMHAFDRSSSMPHDASSTNVTS